MAIFLDIEGDFDIALRKSVESALAERGVETILIGLIYGMLINRTATQ